MERAVGAVVEEGYRTADISNDGTKPVTTSQMGQAICDALQ